MISRRQAALLGLTTPLTAIMIALLGIWPEQEDQPALDLPSPVRGNGRGYTGDGLKADTYTPPEDNTFQVRNNNKAIIAAIVAMVASGVL